MDYSRLSDSYRTGHELIEFNSDLNKFLHENCTKEMSVMDVDCITYKRSKRRLRFIESKHVSEGFTGYGQPELLQLLAKAATVFNYLFSIFQQPGGFGRLEAFLPPSILGCLGSLGARWDVVIIWGNAPFDEVMVHDLVGKHTYHLNKEQLISYLEFRSELEELECQEPLIEAS
jgi:hypothetical protein